MKKGARERERERERERVDGERNVLITSHPKIIGIKFKVDTFNSIHKININMLINVRLYTPIFLLSNPSYVNFFKLLFFIYYFICFKTNNNKQTKRYPRRVGWTKYISVQPNISITCFFLKFK
jgi:hypothetical protein